MPRLVIIDADQIEGLTTKARLLYLHLCTVAGWGPHTVWGVNVGACQYLTTVTDLAQELGWSEKELKRNFDELISRRLLAKCRVRVFKPPRKFGSILTLTQRNLYVTPFNALETKELQGVEKPLKTPLETPLMTPYVTPFNTLETKELQGVKKPLKTPLETQTNAVTIKHNNSGGGDMRVRAREDELATLLADENTRFVIDKLAGGLSDATELAHEFAVRQTLANTDEHGLRLAEHFGYWIACKREAQRRQSNGNLQQQKADQMRRDLDAVAEYGRTGRLPSK